MEKGNERHQFGWVVKKPVLQPCVVWFHFQSVASGGESVFCDKPGRQTKA